MLLRIRLIIYKSSFEGVWTTFVAIHLQVSEFSKQQLYFADMTVKSESNSLNANNAKIDRNISVTCSMKLLAAYFGEETIQKNIRRILLRAGALVAWA